MEEGKEESRWGGGCKTADLCQTNSKVLSSQFQAHLQGSIQPRAQGLTQNQLWSVVHAHGYKTIATQATNNKLQKQKKTKKKKQPFSPDVIHHIYKYWQWEGLANTCPASSFPEASTCLHRDTTSPKERIVLTRKRPSSKLSLVEKSACEPTRPCL